MSGIVLCRILLRVVFVILLLVIVMVIVLVIAGQQKQRGTQLVGYYSIRVWIRDRSKIVKRLKINTTGEDYRENVVDYAVQQ